MSLIYHIVVKDSMAVYFTTNDKAARHQGQEEEQHSRPSEQAADGFQAAEGLSGGQRRFNWPAFWGVFIRGINHMLLICMTFVAFKYAALAQINQGVIASLFTSGVIFTSALFFCIYREALTIKDLIGMFFIIAGVALIGFGKEQDVESVDGDQDQSSSQPESLFGDDLS